MGTKHLKAFHQQYLTIGFENITLKQVGVFRAYEKNFHNKIKDVLKKKDTLGLNVTIPFKNKIIKHLGKIDAHAKKIGANCVTNKKTIKEQILIGQDITKPYQI